MATIPKIHAFLACPLLPSGEVRVCWGVPASLIMFNTLCWEVGGKVTSAICPVARPGG